MPAVLSVEVEGMGEGRPDGSSRAKMPQEYKRLQAAVLDKSLKDQRDQKSRMVVVRRNKDLHFLLLTASCRTHRNSQHIFL